MPSMLDAQRSTIGSLAKLGDGVRANSDAKTQAGLSRGAGQSKKLVNAAWTQTFPAQGATLDLDFANDRGFVRGVGQGRSMDAVTFTRASNGTFVKPDGTLGQHSNQGALGNNLLTFPQDFNNAAWTKTNSTVTENLTIAPNGNLTADYLIDDAVSTSHYTWQAITVTGNVVASVFLKANTLNFASLQVIASSGRYNVTIDLSDGTFGSSDTGGTSPTGTSYSITPFGNDWYRLQITIDNTSGTVTLLVSTSNSSAPSSYHLGRPSYVGSGNGVFIWGAQLELGSTATEYFPTNINQPRFDWASTAVLANKNLLSYTEQFNNTAFWTVNNGAITANVVATTDPLGGNTADLYAPATSGSNRVTQTIASVTSLNIKTISVYAKAGGVNFFSIRDNTAAWAWFDLANGVLGTVTSGYTASITSVGNGWYRCVATFTGGVVAFPSFMLSDTNNSSFVTATGLTGVYFWGAQGETGTTVTDYQPIAQATTNTPLLANPTSNGLLIEEARTNRILWCRDATQTNWTKTNVTVAKTQTGIDGVASSASSLTASSANGTCIQTITLSSGSRTGSVYLKRITGTGTIQVTLDGTTYSTVELSTTDWRRIVLSGTVTNPTVGIRIVTSGDAVAMDFGQVEDGAFVTSPIMTTTATVTRAVDVASMSGANFDSWYLQGKGTLTGTFFDTPSTGVYFSISNGALSNNTKVYKQSSTSIRVDVNTAGTLNYAIATSSIPNPNSFNSCCFGFINYNSFLSVSGQPSFTETAIRPRIIQTNLNLFRIGADATGVSTTTTYIKRVFYIPQRLADNSLQVISGFAV